MSSKKPTSIPARAAPSFIARFPPGMRDRIADLANKYHRTMQREIVTRLHESLIQDGGVYGESLDEFKSPVLSKHELELLRSFRELDPQQQEALVSLITGE